MHDESDNEGAGRNNGLDDDLLFSNSKNERSKSLKGGGL
jgi:hypothetical protein